MPFRWLLAAKKKVKASLEQRLQTLDVADRVLQIEIPQTPVRKLRKDGTHKNVDEKVFPGYVLIRMLLDDESLAGGQKYPPCD
jgi:transcriptional antiterminator NusG